MCVRIHIFCFVVFVFNSLTHFSQPHVNDIAVSALPGNVRAVLEEYLKILRIEDIDECMRQLVSIVGGNLVNYDCSEVLRTVRNYYLKSDRANIKSYKNPTQVIRVNKTYSPVQGEGDCAIQGFVYKIWLLTCPN